MSYDELKDLRRKAREEDWKSVNKKLKNNGDQK